MDIHPAGDHVGIVWGRALRWMSERGVCDVSEQGRWTGLLGIPGIRQGLPSYPLGPLQRRFWATATFSGPSVLRCQTRLRLLGRSTGIPLRQSFAH